MLSDQVLMELARNSPLREELISTAWSSLSTESKLEVVDAVAPTRYRVGSPLPGFLLDLALSDPAPIVRFWAARSYHFRKPVLGADGKVVSSPAPGIETPPEEYQRTARVEGDRSPLVRAAASASRGLGLSELLGLSQLERLVKIRTLDRPATEGFADFVREATAKGVAPQEIQECMYEYFGRDDVSAEVLELDPDGASEFSKQRGWKRLWTIAATAPIEIGRIIAWYARLEGKYWSIDLKQLTALPNQLKEIVVQRDEAGAQKMRDAVNASPEKYDKEVVDAVRKYEKMRAEYGGYSQAEEEKRRLESMPNRQDAIFDSVKQLREEVEKQGEAIASLAKEADLAKATQKIVNWIVLAAVGLGLVLIYFAPRR